MNTNIARHEEEQAELEGPLEFRRRKWGRSDRRRVAAARRTVEHLSRNYVGIGDIVLFSD